MEPVEENESYKTWEKGRFIIQALRSDQWMWGAGIYEGPFVGHVGLQINVHKFSLVVFFQYRLAPKLNWPDNK